MSSDRRNPYVILGVPFGATEEEARAGFARARRTLRGDPDVTFTNEDLTWALHQIEQLIANPELAVDVYRIPANPNVIGNETTGLFNPPPHPADRRTEPDETQWATIRREALANALLRMAGSALSEKPPTIPYE